MAAQHRQHLATLGHPGDEGRASDDLALHDGQVVEELTGEPVSREDLQVHLAQAERYVNNLRHVLDRPG